MADIGALIVRIGADASELTKALSKIEGDARGLEASLSNVGRMAQIALLGMATSAVVATVDAGRLAEQFDQLSQKTGIAVDKLEGYRVALARNGIEAESLTTAFKTLSKDLSTLTTTGSSATGALESMGIGIETSLKGTDAVMRAVADRFQHMADGAEKSRLAVELFGKSGLQLIPILNQGSAGLDAAIKKSAEFGLILTQTQRGALTTFDDAVDDMGSALQGFKMQLGAAFAPAMTTIVQAMTASIVFLKDTFNAFADAGEKLTIRLGAMAAAVSILAKQLFSFSVLSKEAWADTLTQVQAIDQWAAAQIQAVDANRQKASAETLAAGATQQHTAAMGQSKAAAEQEAAGQKILLQSLSALRDERSKGYAQEQLGQFQMMRGIERHKKQVADAAEASRLTFGDQVNGLNSAAPGSTPFIDHEAARQQAMGRSAVIAEQYAQKEAQAWVDAYMEEEAAMLKRTEAEIRASDKNQEYQGRFIVQQAQHAKQAAGFWQNSLQMMQESATYAFGSIRIAFGNVVVGMIQGTATIQDFFKSMAGTILNTVVQLGINLALEWIKTNAVTVAANTAGATATTGIWAGAFATIQGMALATGAAFKGLIVEIVWPAIVAVGEAIMGVLSAIAEAAADTIFGIPYAAMILAGVVAIGVAIAAGVGAFANGGIVTGPTTALIGEAGSPEAVIPLNSRGSDFMQKAFGGGMGGGQKVEQTIVLDGRVLARSVGDNLPSVLRMAGVPA